MLQPMYPASRGIDRLAAHVVGQGTSGGELPTCVSSNAYVVADQKSATGADSKQYGVANEVP